MRNTAAARGTDVHGFAEELVHGRPVDVPADLVRRVDGYARWLDAWGVRPLLTERPCANREAWYAGRFDLVATIGETTWLLDCKTSRGVYGDTSLQLAAYARAEFYVDDDGAEFPLPHIERIGVAHITDDGTDLYEMGSVGDGFRAFLHAKGVYEDERRRRRLGEVPLSPATAGGLW